MSQTSEKTQFFPEYGSDYSFPKFEESILKYWKDSKVFDSTLDPKTHPKTFTFYDGPPFATGVPHYGHILAGTIKDIVPRYWTMRGYRVPRRFGWDCHGLPVEFEMEKTLKLNGSLEVQAYGVDKFNEACRGIVLRYTSEWRKTVERMGRWVDMDNDYKTMDPEFMESVWWVFKELFKKGLIYEGKKVVPYSWRLTAPLSNFETSLNYQNVQDPAVTVLLKLKTPEALGAPKNTAVAIWTTTPWTLPANLAVAAHPKTDHVSYGLFELPIAVGQTTHVIVSSGRAESLGLGEKIKDIPNNQLIGQFYEPLFQIYNNGDRLTDKAFRIIGADYVSAEDGTGMVHQAPAFGEDDFYACQKEKIRLVDPTNMHAEYTDDVLADPELKSIHKMFVKDADKVIIKALKDKGLLWKQDTLQHNYPYCYRSDTPLIYKAISSWFVKVEAIKEQMLAANQKIHWVPDHIKDGRFGKWLENARDWCISRNRFWGTPIPVWKCEPCGHIEVVGSQADLKTLSGSEHPDLHKHFMDHVHFDCPKCKTKASMKRTPEVLDCWFESGSMPYAQGHYPFENKEHFEKNFPAMFIGEGLDQTRGWFYTLTVLSTALFNQPAFKNCIVNGMVLAEDGKKMSKSLKNYPDPQGLIDRYGADAIRLYLMQSPAMHGQDLRFSEKGMVELMRAVMLPLWNAYGFFASYANIDAWKPGTKAVSKLSMMDHWILARTRQCELLVHQSLEAYKLSEVAPHLVSLIDDLTNWYIRLNRDRFWSENNSESLADKEAAYSTLYSCLTRLTALMAPGMPFLSEILNAALHGQNVNKLDPNSYQSLHTLVWDDPTSKKLSADDETVLSRFSLAQKLILLGRALRGECKIGLRQPLQKMRVAGLGDHDRQHLNAIQDLILNEVNVKSLELVDRASDLVEESVKPNFKTLGKKLGKDMKAVQNELLKWGASEIASFEKNPSIVILGHTLNQEDIEIVRKAKDGRFAMADFGLVAELDISLTPELVREGLQREIINRIQQRRKDSKLHLADRIEVLWSSTPGSLVESILLEESTHATFMSHETLSVSFVKSTLTNEAEVFDQHGSFSFEIKKA